LSWLITSKGKQVAEMNNEWIKRCNGCGQWS
jgi:hypothetical protein